MPKQSSAEEIAHGRRRCRVSMVGFGVFFCERPRLLTFVVGIDVNSLFTSLLISGSTFESWYGNCFGTPFARRYWGWLLIYHVDCIKRGSGWHLSRALLAWSSDRIPSSPPPPGGPYTPQILLSPLYVLRHFFPSFFSLLRPNHRMFCPTSTLLYEFLAVVPYSIHTRVFGLLIYIPT